MQSIENKMKKFQTVDDFRQANVLKGMKRVSSADVTLKDKKGNKVPVLMQNDLIQPIKKKVIKLVK